ncbi:MAG: hypothetical protein HY319_01510 [Armatimonadetes bacterium]|nr:hypothetical protein [Armatimonadota bacterium]
MEYRWGGIFHLEAGVHTLSLGDGPDPDTRLCLLPVGSLEVEDEVSERARHLSEDRPRYRSPGQALEPGEIVYCLELSTPGEKRFPVIIPDPGRWAFFTGHDPEELEIYLLDPSEHGAPSPCRVALHWTQER